MRVEMIAFRREMRAAQTVGPAINVVGKRGGNDERISDNASFHLAALAP